MINHEPAADQQAQARRHRFVYFQVVVAGCSSPTVDREAMASAEGDLTREDADKMRVVDLKEALKERHLPTDGKKVRA